MINVIRPHKFNKKESDELSESCQSAGKYAVNINRNTNEVSIINPETKEKIVPFLGYNSKLSEKLFYEIQATITYFDI